MARFNFSALNKERLFTFDASIIQKLHPDKKERYTSLENLYKENGPDMEYQIKGCYINTKSAIEEIDEAPVVALATIYVNIPQHQLGAIKAMIADRNAVKAINDGEAGFKIRTYTKARGKKDETFYEAVWIEVDPDNFEEDVEDVSSLED